MKPVAERRRPQRYKGQPRGPRPADWVNPVQGMKLPRGRTTAERFFSKVDKAGPNGCWIWTGAKRPYGYGNFYLRGGNVQAHRVSLELVGRTPGPDDAVDHLCKNPSCVNPAHLRVVSHRQNALENNLSPFAKNAEKAACPKGHRYTADNTAIKAYPGKPRKNGKVMYGLIRSRVCLACYPESWRYAIVEKKPLHRNRKPYAGPQCEYTLDAEGIVRIPKNLSEEVSRND